MTTGSLPTRRFYAGQVWAEHFRKPTLPQRSTTHRNYLPEAVYPMSQLPPFAIGPHYLLRWTVLNLSIKTKMT